jgi:lipid-A-disaccharide synthase-like uncharacterized protein
MTINELQIIPYTATSLSVIGRFIFMFILYKNKSTNTFSLIFCILSIISSGLWIHYSVKTEDKPLIVRGSIEISLLTISSMYIIHNKIKSQIIKNKIPINQSINNQSINNQVINNQVINDITYANQIKTITV